MDYSETATVSGEQISQDLSSLLQGKVHQDAIDSSVQVLASSSNTAYGANGSVVSLIFWMKCQCIVTGGKTFDGSAWGISVPGGGALFGDVYTSDINALYANTVSFTLVCTPVYTTFIFNDVNGNALGSFQAGSISTVSGTGGGSGKWS